MQLWSILKVILSGSRSVWSLYRIILLLIEFMRISRIHLIPFLEYSWLARITGGRVSAVEVLVLVINVLVFSLPSHGLLAGRSRVHSVMLKHLKPQPVCIVFIPTFS